MQVDLENGRFINLIEVILNMRGDLLKKLIKKIKMMSYLLEKFPLKQQKYNYDCAICSFWCVLHYFGSKIRYDDLITLARTNPEEGTYNVNIIKMLDELGVDHVAEKVTIKNLRYYTLNDFPVIIDIQYRKEYRKDLSRTWKYGHYVVVLAVIKNRIIFMDPNYGELRSFTIKQLKERWHDEDAGVIYRNYAIICLSKENKYYK